MNDYKNILLAIDFTDYGDYVAQQAKHLTEKFNAKLSVIHVLDNIPMPDTTYGTVISLESESTDELLEAEKTKFIRIADQLKIEPYRRWLIWGRPQEEIPLLAKQKNIDLIVVGSHGRHGIALLLGSTVDGVLHHANCDVLAVRLQD